MGSFRLGSTTASKELTSAKRSSGCCARVALRTSAIRSGSVRPPGGTARPTRSEGQGSGPLGRHPSAPTPTTVPAALRHPWRLRKGSRPHRFKTGVIHVSYAPEAM
jgi:hypothetical protein